MISEKLQVLISAKISDFTKKMDAVDAKLSKIQKGSKTASKTVDQMFKSKATGTHKALDLMHRKLQQTEKSATRMSAAMGNVDTSKLSAAQAKLAQINAQMADQARKRSALAAQQSAITSGAKTPASIIAMEKEYKQLGVEIMSAKTKQSALNAEIERLRWNEQASAGSGDIVRAEGYHAQIRGMQGEATSINATISSLTGKAAKLQAEMQSVRMNPATSAEALALADKIALADARMEQLKSSSARTTSQISAMNSVSPGMEQVNQKLNRIERSSHRTANAVSKLSRRFLVLFTGKLISLAFRGVQESLEGATKQSDELKSSMDSLSSSGRTISNSVIAALAPLLNVAAPAIDFIARKIVSFSNNIAMFFAAITGQETVLQATVAFEAYGTAAQQAGADVASGAKTARNALAGFDQITKLDFSSSSGSGSGSSGSSSGSDKTSFTTVPVVQSPLTQKVSDMIKDLEEPLTKLWENILKPFGDWAIGVGLPAFVGWLADVGTWFADHPTTTTNLAALLVTLLALSKLGTIALAVKATLTGLGLLGPLLGTGGAAAAGTLTIGATLSIAAASIAVAYIVGSLVVDAIKQEREKRPQAEIDAMTLAGSQGDMTELQAQTNKDLSKWNYFKGVDTSALYMQGYQDAKPDADKAEAKNIQNSLNSGNYLQAISDALQFNLFGQHTEGGKAVLAQEASLAAQKLEQKNATAAQQDLFQSLGFQSLGSQFKLDVPKTPYNFGIGSDVFSGMPTNPYSNAAKAAELAEANDYLNQSLSTTTDKYGDILTVTMDTNDSLVTSGGTVNNALSRITDTLDLTTMSAGKLTQKKEGNISSWAQSSASWIKDKLNPQVSTAAGGFGGLRTSVSNVAGTMGTLPTSASNSMSAFAGNIGAGARLAGALMTSEIGIGTTNALSPISLFVSRGSAKMQLFARNVQLAASNAAKSLMMLPPNTSRAVLIQAYENITKNTMQPLQLLAQGGYVKANSPRQVIVGDNTREGEIIAPESKIAAAVAAGIAASGGRSGGDIYVTVQTVVDGRIIAEKTTKAQKRAARLSNKPVFGTA